MAKLTPQPALFPLVDDARPAAEKSAAERYREPSLFSGDQPPEPSRCKIEYACGAAWLPYAGPTDRASAFATVKRMRTMRPDVNFRIVDA